MHVWMKMSEWDTPQFLRTLSTWPPCIMSVEIQEKSMCEPSRGSPAGFTGREWGVGWPSNTRQMQKWKKKEKKTKTNISQWKHGVIHVEETNNNIKLTGWRCRKQDYVISAVELIRHFLPLSAGPLAWITEDFFLWTRLFREPSTVLCMCERQTLGKLSSQFSGFYRKVQPL